MMEQFNIMDGWLCARWLGHVVGLLVHSLQVLVIAFINVGLCELYFYSNPDAVMKSIPYSRLGFWCGMLREKWCMLEWAPINQCLMLSNWNSLARSPLVHRFLPPYFSSFRFWEFDVLNFGTVEHSLLSGFYDSGCGVDTKNDILEYAFFTPVFMREGGFDDGRFLMFSGVVNLGLGNNLILNTQGFQLRILDLYP